MQIIQDWKTKEQESIRVVCFGSSNTELTRANQGRLNWVDWLHISLRSVVGQHVNIINQGRNGNTAQDLLARIHRDVVSFNPSMVIVTVGGNDAKTEANTAAYEERLRSICDIVKQHGGLPVLQTYYCPAYHEGTPDYEERFARNMQTARDVAEALELPLVDQYRYFEPFYRTDPDTYGWMMRDWLHVNHLGNLMMAVIMAKSFDLPSIPIPGDVKEQAEHLMAKMGLA